MTKPDGDPTLAYLMASGLNVHQVAAVEHYRGLNVPAEWFVGRALTTADSGAYEPGTREVIAVGGDFVWSFIILPDGEIHAQEAKHEGFSTGIEV